MSDENKFNLTPGLSDLYGNPSDNKSTTEDSSDDQATSSNNTGTKLPEMNYAPNKTEEPEKNLNFSEPDFSDIGLGAGSYMLGKKLLNPNSILSPDVMNTALNLAKTNNSLDIAMDVHKTNLQRLEEAKQNHDYWHSDEAINDNLPDQFKPSPPVTEPPSLTVLPEGGEGVGNYAEKYLPPHLANQATSMQDVQGRLIPLNDSQSATTQRLAPGTVLTEESPLALDPAAQKAKIAQIEAADSAKSAVQSKFAPIQKNAVDLLKNAQDNASKSQQVLDELASKQAQQSATLTSKTTSMNPNLTAEADRMAQTGTGGLSWILKGGANVLRKGLAGLNFAAIPYETRQAIESGKNGDWTGALTHGATALGSAAQLAPEAAALTGIGIEAAPEIALAGGALGLAGLGHDVYEQYPAIKDWVQSKLQK